MESSDVAEIKRRFNAVAEGLEKKIQLVAESVAFLDEKVDRRMTALEEKMDQGFDEVKAMTKFSYAELDRRARRATSCRSSATRRAWSRSSVSV